MAFTKNQAEFMKRVFGDLIGDRKFIEVSWYGYKAHSHPLEAEARTLNKVNVYEYEHAPGSYGFNIGTSYGVTGCPDDFKCVSIDADDFTIHFRYLEGKEVKVYRAFVVLKPDDGFDREYWMKWRNAMEESWKLANESTQDGA